MYQALYRKWRPKKFTDVIGQDHVTKTLQNEIISGRTGHAYLFVGSRGTGKTTCAKIFAQSVNCLCQTDGDPCSKCEICFEMENSSLMDIIELDAASNNGVNDIRSICESAAFTPAVAKYRVYIIDEVHMLSPGAFNALLKTLEEPPKHVIFILATTEAHKVPATILSRCQRFEFHKISVNDISKRLNFIAEKENFTLDPQAAETIARVSDGAMRDALTILDKCVATGKAVSLEKVLEVVGIAGQEYMFEFCDAIFENNAEKALALVDKLNKESKDPMRLCEELITFFRNLMILKSIGKSKESETLLNISMEELETLAKLSEKTTLSNVIYIMEMLGLALNKMAKVCNPKVEFEMCVIKLCSPELSGTNASLLVRVERLEMAVKYKTFESAEPSNAVPDESMQMDKKPERKTEKPVSSVQKEENIQPKQPAKEPEKRGKEKDHVPEETTEIQQNATKMQDWPDVLEVLKKYSQTIAAAFSGSVAYISGQYVLIDAPKEVAFELLRKSSQRDKMRVAIKEVTGKSYKLGPYKKEQDPQNADPLEDLVKRAQGLGVSVINE